MLVEFQPIELEADNNRNASTITLVEEISGERNRDFPITFNGTINKIVELLSSAGKTNNSDTFEDIVFLLFKIIGIHSVFRFDRRNQAGKADGFFIIENLAVMYNCTLRTEYADFKQEQIENYIAKLSNKSQLTIDIQRTDGGSIPKTLKISGKNMQVWIITQGVSRELEDNDGMME